MKQHNFLSLRITSLMLLSIVSILFTFYSCNTSKCSVKNKDKDVLVNPQFPGGDNARIKYLKENIQYPEELQDLGIEGDVKLTFVVEADGSITEVVVVEYPHPRLGLEAFRVISSMPKWIPGTKNGVPSRAEMSISIVFKLPTDIPNNNSGTYFPSNNF